MGRWMRKMACLAALLGLLGSVPVWADEESGGGARPARQPEGRASGPKKRVAVLPFSTAGIEHWWHGSKDPGLAISEYIVHELVNSGQYTVIEREQLDKVLKEQNLSISGEVDPTQAIELGRLLGVEYLVMGKLTEFIQSTAKRGGGGFGYGGYSFGGGGSSTQVRVTAVGRAVNTTNGQIASSIKASDNRQASGGGGGHVSVRGFSAGGHDEEDSTGGALGESMQAVAKSFVDQLKTARWEAVEIREKLKAFVINIDGGQAILNIGAKDKMAKGMRFKVYREQSFTDPISNSMKTVQKPVAELRVLEVQDEVSICEISRVESGQQLKVKDLAKEQ